MTDREKLMKLLEDITHKHGYGYVCEEYGWTKWGGTADENA